MFVVSAPSGTGKTTIIKQSQEYLPDIVFSVSHTTRSPRPNEVNGKDYFFISESEFKSKISENDFLEWAEVHGNYYGTSKSQIQDQVKKGKIVILDIDVQGAMQVKDSDELNPVYIFIEPPSVDELEKRLLNRATENEISLRKRISNARNELTFKNRYDYVIVNDDLDTAVQKFTNIICYQK